MSDARAGLSRLALTRRRGRAALSLRRLVAILALPCGLWAQADRPPPGDLPAFATSKLAASLAAASAHRQHVWRDTPPLDGAGMVNGYVEISRGDRRKWEFDMGANALAIDRVLPEEIGGYPVNYGFVPQTVSYDGDPFDVLVLGPPLTGGEVVAAVIVGLMHMEDEKGLDSKVVLSPVGRDGQPLHDLTDAERERIGAYFRIYKRDQPGLFSKVPGWGSAAEGRAYLTTTHAFFRECRKPTGSPCRIALTR
jgi:inorganic pyrophosphatase